MRRKGPCIVKLNYSTCKYAKYHRVLQLNSVILVCRNAQSKEYNNMVDKTSHCVFYQCNK